MNKEEKIEKYGEMLESLNAMRSAVVQDSMASLMVSGVMPKKGQEELKVLSGITSSIFCALGTLGIGIAVDSENEGVVSAEILGKRYSCAKASFDSFCEVSKQELSVSEAYAMSVSSEPPATAAEEPLLKEEDEKEAEPAPSAEETPIGEPTVAKEEETISEPFDAPTEGSEPAPAEWTFVEEEETLSGSENEGEKTSEDTEEPPKFFFEDDFEDEKKDEPAEESADKTEAEDKAEDDISSWSAPGSKVIGGVVGGLKKSDIFVDENVKNASSFIYSYMKLSVTHRDGGRPEEILAMVAPLKISRMAQSNVPIVVTLSNRGQTKTVSSYDTEREGKNMVQIEIGGFYFLVKGSFGDNGQFLPMVVTTGLSAQSGDRVSIVNQKSYGNSLDRDVVNGHIKFHADTDEGPGFIEVFPFGDPSDGDYTVIVKNDEFTETYFVSETFKGNKSVVVYDRDEVPHELKISYDEESEELSASLVAR